MPTRRYAVYWRPDPPPQVSPFRCNASSAVEAIGKFEQDMHTRRLLREPLSVRVHPVLDGKASVDEPARSPAATGVIKPAPFRVRFHPPEARVDDARPAYYSLETGADDEAARIRFEVDGRPAGELREIPSCGGSHWIVSSLEPKYHAIGTCEQLTLRMVCREVERVTEREREQWLQAPGHETAAPERAAGMER